MTQGVILILPCIFCSQMSLHLSFIQSLGFANDCKFGISVNKYQQYTFQLNFAHHFVIAPKLQEYKSTQRSHQGETIRDSFAILANLRIKNGQ